MTPRTAWCPSPERRQAAEATTEPIPAGAAAPTGRVTGADIASGRAGRGSRPRAHFRERQAEGAADRAEQLGRGFLLAALDLAEVASDTDAGDEPRAVRPRCCPLAEDVTRSSRRNRTMEPLLRSVRSVSRIVSTMAPVAAIRHGLVPPGRKRRAERPSGGNEVWSSISRDSTSEAATSFPGHQSPTGSHPLRPSPSGARRSRGRLIGRDERPAYRPMASRANSGRSQGSRRGTASAASRPPRRRHPGSPGGCPTGRAVPRVSRPHRTPRRRRGRPAYRPAGPVRRPRWSPHPSPRSAPAALRRPSGRRRPGRPRRDPRAAPGRR